MKILIVDDNAAVRKSLKILLGRHFDEVATIADPTMLPAILSGGNVDAVLLDMNFDSSRLDGNDGLFWLARIKEHNCAPAVIMITAFGDIPLAVEAMKLGAEDFITKPWDNDDLLQKVRHAIAVNREAKAIKTKVSKASEMEERLKKQQTMTLSELKMEHVTSVIAQCGGNLKSAAERLGINRQTLYNLLRKP